MNHTQLVAGRRLICALQSHIRDTLIAARKRQAEKFYRVAAVTEADTIYYIDRVSEHAIVSWFEEHWPRALPMQLVMEGLENETVTFPRGTPLGLTEWKCILDP